MSDRSREWDKRKGTRGKLPFTPYVLILGGILVLLITLIIIFTTPPIYAQLFGSTLISEKEEIVDLDQSYHIAILQSQELLMEKIDWNNCAISHKGSRSYVYMDNPDTSWGQPYQLYTAYTNNDLIKYCGEIP